MAGQRSAWIGFGIHFGTVRLVFSLKVEQKNSLKSFQRCICQRCSGWLSHSAILWHAGAVWKTTADVSRIESSPPVVARVYILMLQPGLSGSKLAVTRPEGWLPQEVNWERWQNILKRLYCSLGFHSTHNRGKQCCPYELQIVCSNVLDCRDKLAKLHNAFMHLLHCFV